MGVFKRTDSKFWWIYNENTKRRTPTEIVRGETIDQQKDSKKLAQELYHREMTQSAGRVHKLETARPAIRFSAFAPIFKDNVIAKHKGKVRETDILDGKLVKFFGTRTERSGERGQPNDDLLSLIDKERHDEYIAWRMKAGIANRTINRELAVLKQLLNYAAPKYIERNPLDRIKHLPVLTPRRRLTPAADQKKLLKVAERDPQDHALLVLAWDTLQRMGDLLDLKKAHRRKGDWIWIADPKNAKGIEIPLSTRAAKALDKIERLHHASEYYFPKFRTAKNPDNFRQTVTARMIVLCKHAKVPYGKKHDGFTFHWGTRRTSTTHLLQKKGVAISTVQALGGWKKPDVPLSIYNEADKNDLLHAVGRRKRA